MMYINPEECVECGRCEPVCPTISIFHEEDLPDDRADYREINEAVFVDLGMPSPGGARLLGPQPQITPLSPRCPSPPPLRRLRSRRRPHR